MQYQNVIIGRYSNRIPTGDYNLEKDGAKSEFKSLANGERVQARRSAADDALAENEKVSLHGGPAGLDIVEWETVKVADAKLFGAKEREQLEAFPPDSVALFRYTSPDGDSGFPGVLHLEVLFALVPTSDKVAPDTKELALGSLVIVYRAKVDEKDGAKVVTPVNLTQVRIQRAVSTC